MSPSKPRRSRRVLAFVLIATVALAATASLVIAQTSGPGPVARVALTIDGVELASFRSMTEMISEADLSTGPEPVRIVLRDLLSNSLVLDAWHQAVRDGDVVAARKSFTLVFYSPEGVATVRYNVEDGFPSALKVTGEPATKGAELLYRSVTFTAADAERVAP